MLFVKGVLLSQLSGGRGDDERNVMFLQNMDVTVRSSVIDNNIVCICVRCSFSDQIGYSPSLTFPKALCETF